MSDVEEEVPGEAGDDEFAGLPEVRVRPLLIIRFRMCCHVDAPPFHAAHTCCITTAAHTCWHVSVCDTARVMVATGIYQPSL